MGFRKIGRRLKAIFFLIAAFCVIMWMLVMGFLIVAALSDTKALQDTVTMNRIALLLGLASVPGFFTTFVAIATINEKKEFSVSCKCPNCRHLIELKMTED